MNCIRRAAYFNSSGATLLATNEAGKALKAFKISLKCLAEAIVEANNDGGRIQDNPTDASGIISRAVPRSRMDLDQEDCLDELGQPYLYSKGLVFYPNSTVTLVDLSFYSSVVVFNLVLAYHRRSKSLQEADLKKLLQLYELCLRLISEGARSSHYDCCNLMVAALNNKSVVHSELGQHTRARRMLYHVWDVMKYPERRPGLMETWEVEGIFLNIYLILVNSPQVASAA